MTTYTFQTSDGSRLAVEAPNEGEARRLVMLRRYGPHADPIVPHAPNYQGEGLALVSTVEAP